jgi:hypothetical protein
MNFFENNQLKQLQVDMDVSGSVPANLMDVGYPSRHNGLLRALPKFNSLAVCK